MESIESVITGLKTITDEMQAEVNEWCDYSDSELTSGVVVDCDWWLDALGKCSAALEFLKATQREGIRLRTKPCAPDIEGNTAHDGHGSWWYVCGACRQPIDKGDGYCRHCGKGVLWNETQTHVAFDSGESMAYMPNDCRCL